MTRRRTRVHRGRRRRQQAFPDSANFVLGDLPERMRFWIREPVTTLDGMTMAQLEAIERDHGPISYRVRTALERRFLARLDLPGSADKPAQ